MERNLIIKALECCTRGRKNKEDRPCLECPYNECNLVGGTSERQVTGTCQGWLMKDALSIIKELTEENERLRAEVSVKKKLLDKAEVRIECVEDENNQLKADICNENMNLEHMTKENERLRDTAYRLECEVHRERANTVRKMQERLTKEFDRMHKSNFLTVEVRQWIIDQIAKEMVEGKE